MYQYYIIEIQKNANGEYGHIVHFAYDENEKQARLKADSKYYEVLSAAAVSSMLTHAATLVSSQGEPLMHMYYDHEETVSE